MVRRTALLAGLVLLIGCGQTVSSASPGADTEPLTLRLGVLPNLTHAPALVGLKKGFFADALGGDVTIETHVFNAGPDAATAILSGAIDATFIGPNPTVNAYVQSHGQAIRVVSGATSGGALLVVKPGINSVAALRGKRIADPQLGGTQDIALRWFLQSNGLKGDVVGGGDVAVLPEDNSQTLVAFKQGKIDGAWLPEPWASRLVVESGGKVMVDERDLWPQGKFVTTNLVISAGFLAEHSRRVKALLEGLFQAVAYMNANPGSAQDLTDQAITDITGTRIRPDVIAAAWPHMTFTVDPLASTLQTSAGRARSLGLLSAVGLKGLYDLTLLNQVLREHNDPEVNGL